MAAEVSQPDRLHGGMGAGANMFTDIVALMQLDEKWTATLAEKPVVGR